MIISTILSFLLVVASSLRVLDGASAFFSVSPYHERAQPTFTKTVVSSYFNTVYDFLTRFFFFLLSFRSLMLHWSQDYGGLFVFVRLLNFDSCRRRTKKMGKSGSSSCRVFVVGLHMFIGVGGCGCFVKRLASLIGKNLNASLEWIIVDWKVLLWNNLA